MSTTTTISPGWLQQAASRGTEEPHLSAFLVCPPPDVAEVRNPINILPKKAERDMPNAAKELRDFKSALGDSLKKLRSLLIGLHSIRTNEQS